MNPRFIPCILLLVILVLTIPVFAAAAPVSGNDRVALTTVPATTTSAPVTTVSCAAPCQCLLYADAVSQWGADGFTPCAEHPCEVSRSITGAPVEKYCYKPKEQVAPATTTPAQILITRTLPAPLTTTPAPILAARTKPTATPTLVQFADVPAPATAGTPSSGIFQPLSISVGKTQLFPFFDTSSPYFARQFGSKEKKMTVVTFSSLEVDEINDELFSYFSGNTVHTNPLWGETDTSIIGRNVAEDFVNFRWTTAEKDVKAAVFQVSRYPFPADPDHWQNQYVPGLAGSGQVKDIHVETDADTSAEFHYFRINFARAANRNPGLPPFFDGTASISQDNQGIGEVQQMTKVPLVNTGIVMTDYSIGSFHVGLPSGIVPMASDDLTQAELGNLNENLQLSCTDFLALRPFTPIEASISETDQTYYVRVVPIHANGKAGLPTLPVRVIVTRPKACPAGLGSTVPISPPSVKVLSFTPTVIIPQVPGNVQYFVSVKDPNSCAGKHKLAPGTEPGQDPFAYESGSVCDTFNTMYHGQVGWHRANYVAWHYEPESDWWDFLPDFIVDIINTLNEVYNKISQTWNEAQALAAKLTAEGWSFLITGGMYRCDQEVYCLDMVLSGQSAAIAAIGVPPTLPTYDEMMDSGEEYLIQVTAEELGAGEIYNNIPDEVKAEIRSDTRHYAKELVGGQTSARKDQLAKASGSWAMLDPLIYSPHPAIVIVRVYNPAGNPQSTSSVIIRVRDSAGLYEPVSKYVPALAPREGVAIPVSLPEDYAPFKGDTGCPDDESRDHCIMGKWLAHRNGISVDTFEVSVQYKGANGGSGINMNQDAYLLDNLGPDSNGKKLSGFLQMDPGTQTCPATPSVISYPAGWTMKITGKTLDPNQKDPDFLTDGGVSGEGTIRTSCTLPDVC